MYKEVLYVNMQQRMYGREQKMLMFCNCNYAIIVVLMRNITVITICKLCIITPYLRWRNYVEFTFRSYKFTVQIRLVTCTQQHNAKRGIASWLCIP